VKVGDLVSLNWGSVPELECVKPNEWFDRSVKRRTPMIFLGWAGNDLTEDGWATLLHPDGSKKIIHCDYFIKLTK
jgi:hypothetical protein